LLIARFAPGLFLKIIWPSASAVLILRAGPNSSGGIASHCQIGNEGAFYAILTKIAHIMQGFSE